MQALAQHREEGCNYDVDSLVRVASAAAGRILATLAWYYPELRPADERRWEFLATAAGLYLASEGFELTSADRRKLPDHLAQATASCRHFVARAGHGTADRLTLHWAVGTWVLSGIFRQQPRAEQAWMAAAVGEALDKTSRVLADLTRYPLPASRALPAVAAVATR